MPINQNPTQHSLSIRHIEWLEKHYKNVKSYVINLIKFLNLFKIL